MQPTATPASFLSVTSSHLAFCSSFLPRLLFVHWFFRCIIFLFDSSFIIWPFAPLSLLHQPSLLRFQTPHALILLFLRTWSCITARTLAQLTIPDWIYGAGEVKSIPSFARLSSACVSIAAHIISRVIARRELEQQAVPLTLLSRY